MGAQRLVLLMKSDMPCVCVCVRVHFLPSAGDGPEAARDDYILYGAGSSLVGRRLSHERDEGGTPEAKSAGPSTFGALQATGQVIAVSAASSASIYCQFR